MILSMVMTTGMKLLTTVAVFLAALCFVSGNKCTNVLSKSNIVETIVKEPCLQKYTARCGWLSLNYCTFYHNTYCDKRVNETRKSYFIKTQCCKGYILANNGSCIKPRPGVIYHIKTTPASPNSRKPGPSSISNLGTNSTSQEETTVDPHYKHEPEVDKQKVKDVKVEISGGGYAGIVCGFVLLVTIIVFIIIAVRKRKHKKQQLEATQAKRVLYIGPSAGNQPIVRNSGNSRTPTVLITKDETPSSSNMVTPPTSPVKTTLSVEVPLISENVDDEDIPESDV